MCVDRLLQYLMHNSMTPFFHVFEASHFFAIFYSFITLFLNELTYQAVKIGG